MHVFAVACVRACVRGVPLRASLVGRLCPYLPVRLKHRSRDFKQRIVSGNCEWNMSGTASQ